MDIGMWMLHLKSFFDCYHWRYSYLKRYAKIILQKMEIYKNHYCVRRWLQWVCVNIWPIFHLKLQRFPFGTSEVLSGGC